MRFKARRGDRVELNLTSLIDVVFMLLIFFVVTTTFNRHGELKIQLPEASAKPKQQEEEPVELVIDLEGRYYVNGQALVNTQAVTLMAALEDAIQGRTDMPMLISADRRTPYQAMVTAMDSAARLGLTHLSLPTTQAEDAP
jgi:biopolymer transport protein ExbD